MNVYHRHRSQWLLLDARPRDTPPSKEGAKAHNNGHTETNFDTNMVIILAALLCALICALGLNSIVRCFLRCSRRFAFETPGETAARLAATGLKKRMLRQIPVAVYGNSGIHIPATDCPICLGEFVEGEKVRVLPKCHHGFHVRCIDIWLASHSSCPTCRQSLLEQPPCLDSNASDANESALNLRQPSNTPPTAPAGGGGGGGEGHTDHPAASAEEVG